VNERQAEIAELHFAAQRGGSFLFNGGLELVHRNEERDYKQQDNQDTNGNQDVANGAVHDDLRTAGPADIVGRRPR